MAPSRSRTGGGGSTPCLGKKRPRNHPCTPPRDAESDRSRLRRQPSHALKADQARTRTAGAGTQRVAVSTMHDTAQKRLQQRPEAAVFGMGSKGERFGLGAANRLRNPARSGICARAGNRNIRRFRRAVLTEPAFWSHSSSPLSALALFLGSQRAASFGRNG
jgi:hypothetical protein